MFVRPTAIPSFAARPRWVTLLFCSTASSKFSSFRASEFMDVERLELLDSLRAIRLDRLTPFDLPRRRSHAHQVKLTAVFHAEILRMDDATHPGVNDDAFFARRQRHVLCDAGRPAEGALDDQRSVAPCLHLDRSGLDVSVIHPHAEREHA